LLVFLIVLLTIFVLNKKSFTQKKNDVVFFLFPLNIFENESSFSHPKKRNRIFINNKKTFCATN